MHSDSKTTTVTGAGGAIFGGPSRIVGIYYVAGASAGSVVLRDGGVSGDTVATIATPASATATQYIDLSQAPILCGTSSYAALTNVTSCMMVYS